MDRVAAYLGRGGFHNVRKCFLLQKSGQTPAVRLGLGQMWVWQARIYVDVFVIYNYLIPNALHSTQPNNLLPSSVETVIVALFNPSHLVRTVT